MLLQYAELLGFMDADAACKLTGVKRSTAIKQLATLTEVGHLRKFAYLHPRAYWSKTPLGAQALLYSASLCYRCIMAESRVWRPVERQGPATIIESGSEREALFIDFGAEPRSLTRKIGDWENACLVVPSEGKAQAVSRYIDGVRFVVFPDLWRLQACTKAPR